MDPSVDRGWMSGSCFVCLFRGVTPQRDASWHWNQTLHRRLNGQWVINGVFRSQCSEISCYWHMIIHVYNFAYIYIYIYIYTYIYIHTCIYTALHVHIYSRYFPVKLTNTYMVSSNYPVNSPIALIWFESFIKRILASHQLSRLMVPHTVDGSEIRRENHLGWC